METEKREGSSNLEETEKREGSSNNLEKGEHEHVVVQPNPQYVSLIYWSPHCSVHCLIGSTSMSMTLTVFNDVSSNAMFKCKLYFSLEGTKLRVFLRIAVGFPNIFFFAFAWQLRPYDLDCWNHWHRIIFRFWRSIGSCRAFGRPHCLCFGWNRCIRVRSIWG